MYIDYRKALATGLLVVIPFCSFNSGCAISRFSISNTCEAAKSIDESLGSARITENSVAENINMMNFARNIPVGTATIANYLG